MANIWGHLFTFITWRYIIPAERPGGGTARRGAWGGAPAPPWATAAAAVGPGAVRRGSRGGSGGDNLGRGHTHILDQAPTY